MRTPPRQPIGLGKRILDYRKIADRRKGGQGCCPDNNSSAPDQFSAQRTTMSDWSLSARTRTTFGGGANVGIRESDDVGRATGLDSVRESQQHSGRVTVNTAEIANKIVAATNKAAWKAKWRMKGVSTGANRISHQFGNGVPLLGTRSAVMQLVWRTLLVPSSGTHW